MEAGSLRSREDQINSPEWRSPHTLVWARGVGPSRDENLRDSGSALRRATIRVCWSASARNLRFPRASPVRATGGGASGVCHDQSSPPWGGNGRFHKIPRQIEKYQGGDKIEGRHGSSRLGGSRLGGRGCTETPTRPQYCSMPLEEIASVA
jgi:hypothetical protein